MDNSPKDDFGRPVPLESPPERIVSLVPSVTETLFALGVEDRIAAVTDYCNHPPAACRLTRIGGVQDPRLDEILRLHPDLVVASVSENDRATVEALRRRGVAVYLTGPETVPEAIASIERLAGALGVFDAGELLASRLRKDLASSGSDGPLLPVLFPVWEDPLVLPGEGSFVSDLLRRAGLVSVGEALGKGWPRAKAEFLRGSNAGAVILPTEPYPYTEKDVERWSSWERIPPRARARVFLVDGELTNRPGPRMTEGVGALLAIAKSCVRAAKED